MPALSSFYLADPDRGTSRRLNLTVGGGEILLGRERVAIPPQVECAETQARQCGDFYAWVGTASGRSRLSAAGTGPTEAAALRAALAKFEGLLQ